MKKCSCRGAHRYQRQCCEGKHFAKPVFFIQNYTLLPIKYRPLYLCQTSRLHGPSIVSTVQCFSTIQDAEVQKLKHILDFAFAKYQPFYCANCIVRTGSLCTRLEKTVGQMPQQRPHRIITSPLHCTALPSIALSFCLLGSSTMHFIKPPLHCIAPSLCAPLTVGKREFIESLYWHKQNFLTFKQA